MLTKKRFFLPLFMAHAIAFAPALLAQDGTGEDDSPRGAVAPATNSASNVYGGNQNSWIRLLWGPRRRQETRAEPVAALNIAGPRGTSIRLDNLRGGLVDYDLVEALEFHFPILNSPWFFEQVRTELVLNGVTPMSSKKGTKQITTGEYVIYEELAPRENMRQGIHLIPEILDTKGDQMAEKIYKTLARILRVEDNELNPKQLAKAVETTGLTVEQVKGLRRLLIEQSLNSDEVIDAIHLSSYKAAHIYSQTLRRGLSFFRGLVGRGVARGLTITSGTSLAGFASWTYTNMTQHMSELARTGLSWGDSYFHDLSDADFVLNGKSFSSDDNKGMIEKLRELGLNAEALTDLPYYYQLPEPSYILPALAAISAWGLAHFAPKLWQQSKNYLNLLRNRFLNDYLEVLQTQGVLNRSQLQQAQGIRARALGAPGSDERGPTEFSDPLVVRARLAEANLDETIVVHKEGFATHVSVLGQEQMLFGVDILAQFTKDMAIWQNISVTYKTLLNRAVRVGNQIDLETANNTIHEYQAELAQLSGAIEAYEGVLAKLDAYTLSVTEFLENLLKDDVYLDYVEIRTDGMSDYEVRARRAIEDRISDLVLFRNGTLAILRLSLGNAYDATKAERGDLQTLRSVLSNITLTQTTTQIADATAAVASLIHRRVGEIVTKPSDEAISVSI